MTLVGQDNIMVNVFCQPKYQFQMDTKVFVFSSLCGRNSLRKHQNADGSLGTFPIVIFLHKKYLGILLI